MNFGTPHGLGRHTAGPARGLFFLAISGKRIQAIKSTINKFGATVRASAPETAFPLSQQV